MAATLEVDKEIDDDWPEKMSCAYLPCGKEIEVMFPYLILVVNNDEEPEQRTYRFDSLECLSKWLEENKNWVVLGK